MSVNQTFFNATVVSERQGRP